ncbi:hypothetical protein BC829DRAFT_256189 [Chytridium lagenaria]|nr:hypothetical protein BC829DRAFT_256189 [Chytridium lagenaria]
MLYADEIRRPFVPVITSRLQRSWSEILTAGHIGLQLAETFDRDADEWKAVMEDLLKSILVAAGASELPSPSKARLSTKFTDGTSILLPSEILNRLSTTSNPSHFSPPGTPTRSRRGSAFLRLSSPIPARPNSLQKPTKASCPKGPRTFTCMAKTSWPRQRNGTSC